MSTEKSALTAGDAEHGDEEKVDKPREKKSVMEDIKSAKQQSSSSIHFARIFCGIIFGSVVWTVLVGIFNIIPISMIVIGCIYLNDCTIQRMIPVYLVVMGSLLLFRYVWTSCIRCGTSNSSSNIEEKDVNARRFCNVLVFFLDFFLIVWFLCGNVWIYGNYSDVSYRPSAGHFYCHRLVYLFAFWLTTLQYIILGLCMFCCPCIICYYYGSVQP